jgi:hypothetical protein
VTDPTVPVMAVVLVGIGTLVFTNLSPCYRVAVPLVLQED